MEIFLTNGAFGIFALPWSDKAGRRRRPLIFIPLAGVVLMSLLGCLHSYFWQWAPIAAVISTTVLGTLTGGPLLIAPACQVYICDVCETESRTARIGILGAVQMLGLILGKGGSGFILRKFGFFYGYVLCFAVSACGLLFGSIFIKDTSVLVEKKIPFCRMFSNIGHDLIDNFKVVFRKRLASRRIVVMVLLTTNVVVYFTYFGELSVLYQYLRYRFEWTEREYSEYMFYKFSTSALGTVFCSVILSKYFKLHDGLICIMAASFDIMAILGLLLATRAWQICLLPLIDLFHGTLLVINISFMSKYYHPNEMGRLSAVIGVFLVLPMALSSPVYNAIYKYTLDTFPSAFCILSMVLDVSIHLAFCGAYILSIKLDRFEHVEKSTVVNSHFVEGDDDDEIATTAMMTVSR